MRKNSLMIRACITDHASLQLHGSMHGTEHIYVPERRRTKARESLVEAAAAMVIPAVTRPCVKCELRDRFGFSVSKADQLLGIILPAEC